MIVPDDVPIVSDNTGTALRFEKMLDGRDIAITITSTKKKHSYIKERLDHKSKKRRSYTVSKCRYPCRNVRNERHKFHF